MEMDDDDQHANVKIDGEHTYEWVTKEFRKFITEFNPAKNADGDDLDGDDQTEAGMMMHSSHGELWLL